MISLVLLGGGGHASDVLAVVEGIAASGRRIDLVYVADDAWSRPERFDNRSVDVKMVESIEAGATMAPFVVAVGYPHSRRLVHDMASAVGGEPADPLFHPHASMGSTTSSAPGVVVMGNTWVSPGALIEAHTHLGYGVTVGHDTMIGPFCSIMPGACIGGDVHIGEGALIGANSTVLQGLTIGIGAVVGAGAVVTADVEPGATVVGVPARELGTSGRA